MLPTPHDQFCAAIEADDPDTKTGHAPNGDDCEGEPPVKTAPRDLVAIPRPTLTVRWIALNRARLYVEEHHRHLPRIQGGVIALGCYDGARLCGVCILGRPTARLFDDGETMEVVRCAHDGTANAGSALYGRARKVAAVLGMGRLITYTLPEESGASLRGAGWLDEGEAGGGEWNVPSRARAPVADARKKRRWRAA